MTINGVGGLVFFCFRWLLGWWWWFWGGVVVLGGGGGFGRCCVVTCNGFGLTI